MNEIATERVSLVYDTFGNPNDPTIVLIMGLNTQMTGWPNSFCQDIADAGYHIVRFDNRDVGHSKKFDELGSPNLGYILLMRKLGLRPNAPYNLDDMALDVIDLLDELHIDSAHVVGISMGGMIAQNVTANHPHRSRSLTSIMSSTGSPKLPGTDPKVIKHFVHNRSKPNSVEDQLKYSMETWDIIGSPDYPVPDDEKREELIRDMERSDYTDGFARHLGAIIASGDRTELLRTIKQPTMVIHGMDDPLVPIEHGLATAKAIPNASFKTIKGMGHDLPKELRKPIAKMILKHIDKAEQYPLSKMLATDKYNPDHNKEHESSRWLPSLLGVFGFTS